MKLSVTSSSPLQKFYLKDLHNNKFDIVLDTEQSIPHGWYELCVEYVDTKIEITDILINNASIKHIIYTGFCTDNQGTVHQPATSVWDSGCCFKIWLHTEIGVLYGRILEEINNGDFGTNLFENYMLTVDRPFIINSIWDETIKSFFRNGDGPHWWHNQAKNKPYELVDLSNFDPNKVLSEMNRICNYSDAYQNNRNQNVKKFRSKWNILPLIDIPDIPSEYLQTFFTQAGYKRISNFSIHTLQPREYVWIHRDDDPDNPGFNEYIKDGCKQLYWAISGSEDMYFKLGKSGILPTQYPLKINAPAHAHAVVYQGNKVRTSILVYGELN